MSFSDKDDPFSLDSEPLRSEPQGFAPDQMVRCEACLRANPPTRTICLYCGAEMPKNEALSDLRKPVLRRLEEREEGFNVILVPGSAAHLTNEALQETSQMLRLTTDDLQRIVEAGEPLPLARASTLDEAQLVEHKLKNKDVRVLLIADHDLGLEEATPKRARALELTDTGVVAHPSGGGEPWRASWHDIALLVIGRLFIREIEVEERKSRKPESEMVDARELSTDEAVLDTYTAQGNEGWRISAANFDYSCLGQQKDLVAAQNFSTLAGMLLVKANEAQYDDSYNRVRHVLNYVWPLEQQTESRGWHRRGPGRVSTEAVTRSDNEIQFTRYSRLRRYIQLHHSDLNA